MEYFTKVDILDKISKLIRLYAKHGRAKKYIIKIKLIDEWTHEYSAFFLEEDKMFEHTRQFRLNKSIILDSRGNKERQYYDELDRYFKDNHTIYYNAKFLALKLIHGNDDFAPEDLKHLNSMYKILKALEKKDAKKE